MTFLGTGHGGKIYRIDKDGKAELWFQASEMDVTSLVRDRKGTLYAATSPNGKIYKITDKGKGEEFFNPAEKYIWDLLFLDSGELLGGGRRERRHLPDLPARRRPDVLQGRGEPHPLPRADLPRGRRRRERRQRARLQDLDGGARGGPLRNALRRSSGPGPRPRRVDLRRGVGDADAGAEGRGLGGARASRQRGRPHRQRLRRREPARDRLGRGAARRPLGQGRRGALSPHRRRAGQAPVELRRRDDLLPSLARGREQGRLRHRRQRPDLFRGPGREGGSAPPAELRAGLPARAPRFQDLRPVEQPLLLRAAAHRAALHRGIHEPGPRRPDTGLMGAHRVGRRRGRRGLGPAPEPERQHERAQRDLDGLVALLRQDGGTGPQPEGPLPAGQGPPAHADRQGLARLQPPDRVLPAGERGPVGDPVGVPEAERGPPQAPGPG